MQKVRVLELFAGIGACSKALERLGIEHEIVDAVEIDKYAVASFNAVHGTNFEPQDITKWDKDIECDLIMHGSPCQDFSVAGKGAGGDEGSGTRSSLLYETLRIVDKLRPKYVIWENVKNLLSKKHKHNWDAYAKRMEEMGYTNHAQVLNAKDYGVPQNRERVFTISILGNEKFEFPESIILEKKLKDVLEEYVDEKFYLTESNIKTINRNFGSKGKILDLSGFSVIEKITYPSRINQKKDEVICPTLVSAMGTGGGNVPVINKNDGRLRKLTPKECWRLMGFDDADFEKAAKVNSNTQLYKQAGNSIVVNVLEALLEELLCK
jgi:DNA (cytosine-5)-methyltransferase 1